MSTDEHGELKITIKLPVDVARVLRAAAALEGRTAEEMAAYYIGNQSAYAISGAGLVGAICPELLGEEARAANAQPAAVAG